MTTGGMTTRRHLRDLPPPDDLSPIVAQRRRGPPTRPVPSRAVAGLSRTIVPGLAAALQFALAALPPTAAAQWVEPPGQGWVSLALYHQDTREHFGSSGGRRPFFAQGHAVATSTFATTAVGLLRDVDLWIQLSVHRLRYDDIVGPRTSSGPGDARIWLRTAPLARWFPGLPLAVRGGVKIPVGDFEVDAEVIPLGDGQRDWELLAELGHSFWPRSLYLSGWAGYRWREENRESHKDFGNEFFYYAQLGGAIGPLGVRLAVDGWDGAPGVTEGIRIPTFQRELVQLQPSLLYTVGPGQLELGTRLALRGRNLPAGVAIMAQYFRSWN